MDEVTDVCMLEKLTKVTKVPVKKTSQTPHYITDKLHCMNATVMGA